MELERAIQMRRRGIGQDQYVDGGVELPLAFVQPKGGYKRTAVEDERRFEAGGGQQQQESLFSFFYPVLLSMLLTVLVIFVFIKLRGLVLFRRLLSLFVSSS